jgi:putative Mg2+ transporter-C (MgtC) family protein
VTAYRSRISKVRRLLSKTVARLRFSSAPVKVSFMEQLAWFALNVSAALVMGAALGLERQFRQHPAGLRTITLVSVGAALFVSLSKLMDDSSSPTRIASYIVSGIGFLGGGVIIREGFNVRGMNTAATLWCAAAVGTLAGAGFSAYALVGTFAILTVHVGLRPVAHWIDSQRKTARDVEVGYRLRVLCAEKDQDLVRAILMRHINAHPKMMVQGIATVDTDKPGSTAIEVDIYSLERNDKALEDLVNRLHIEPGVTSVSWEKRT